MKHRIAVSLVFALLVATATVAQRGTTFAENLDVNVVNVEVLVSTKSGAVPTTLSESDFQLSEDGKKVKLSHFSEASELEGADAQQSLILFLDDTHVSQGDRNAVLAQLEPFLARRMAEDQVSVMVVRYDGLPRVMLPFSKEPGALGAILDQIEAMDVTPSQSTIFERTARDSLSSASTQDAAQASRGYAMALQQDTEAALQAVGEVVRTLAARPGRKSLYLVAEGLAVRPLGQLMDTMQRRSAATAGSSIAGGQDASQGSRIGTGVDAAAQASAATAGMSRMSRVQRDTQGGGSREAFDLLAAEANSSRVTLYPIRPPILDAATAELGNRSTDRDKGLTDFREGPLLLAEATGGQAFVVGFDVSGFVADTEEDGVAAYSLGFEPGEHPEGSLHELKLKLKGKGLDMRYRQSYVTKRPGMKLASRALGAVTLGWVDNPHDVKAVLDAKTAQADGNFDVTVLVTFPIGNLELTEAAGVHHSNTRVVLMVVTPQGVTQPQFMDIPLQIPAADVENARQQLFGTRVQMRLPPGDQRLAVGLWDETAQTGSFIAAPLDLSGS